MKFWILQETVYLFQNTIVLCLLKEEQRKSDMNRQTEEQYEKRKTEEYKNDNRKNC